MRKLAVAAVIALAACSGGDTDVQTADGPGGEPAADAPGDDAGTSGLAPPSGDGPTIYEARATVLQEADGEPMLCLGGVMESYPPQCGGPIITGWDWSEVDGAESANGVTWGDFVVRGTWDGETFGFTGIPDEPLPVDDRAPDFSTPCPEPEGGWVPVDPDRTSEAEMEAATSFAVAQSTHAGLWVDQSINPASDRSAPDGDGTADEGATGEAADAAAIEAAMNDPALLVLNVRTTGDVDELDAELRARWGGAQCVIAADRSLEQLTEIRTDVQSALEFLYSSIDETTGTIEIGVIAADPDVQADLDERYGEGTVRLDGALRPVDA